MTDVPLLEIRNVSAFRGNKQVFNDLSLTIPHHQSVAILGPNGCGKTTLLKLLMRDIYPVVKDDSFLKINGSETVNLMALRQLIGVVSQDLQDFYTPYTKGADVVASGLVGAIGTHSHIHLTAQQLKCVGQAIQHWQLEELADTMFQHLSTGQQRRLLLARAMIHHPATLIFDEPTNSLDMQAAFALIKTLRQLVQQGTDLILATHHVQEIIPEIDRVVFMKHGAVIADGKKQELLTSRNISDLYETDIKLVEEGGFYQAFPG